MTNRFEQTEVARGIMSSWWCKYPSTSLEDGTAAANNANAMGAAEMSSTGTATYPKATSAMREQTNGKSFNR
jgi:hypothetical protein